MHRRSFLQLTAAAATASLVAPSWATEAPRTFEVERTGPDQLSLQWSGFDASARLYASSDPEAPAALMRPLDAPRRARGFHAALPVSPRPYFLIEGANGAHLRTAERILPLEGGRNFRDLGGYETEDGRHVRWGALYRSGVLHGLTLADYDYLRQLGVRTICDFRATQERQAEPTTWAGADAPDIFASDYDNGLLRPDLSVTDIDAARTAVAATYAQMLTLLTPQYTDMFRRLVRHETPLAFHCSAGKDRTGIAAALILSVLGTPRQTVVRDYGLSERYLVIPPLDQVAGGRFAHLPPGVARAFVSVDPVVMERTLAALDTQYGGPTAAVQRLYGVSNDEIELMRRLYLE